MARSKKSSCGRKTPCERKSAVEPTEERKRPLRFSGHQDIQLLREVVTLKPFKDAPPTTVWASISRNLEDVRAITARRCRERTILMLDQYIKGDMASLQRFCTQDEFVTKEQLLEQVVQQYMSGPGGYSALIGSGMGSAPNAANAQDEEGVEEEKEYEENEKEEGDGFELYKGRAVPEEVVTPEQSDSGEGTSKTEDKDDEQPASSKRPRLTEDYKFTEEFTAAVASAADEKRALSASPDAGSAKRDTGRHASTPTVAASEFPLQVVTRLLSLQAKEAVASLQEMKICREKRQLEKARLRLEDEKLALAKARLDMERHEHELRYHTAMQERTSFVEVLNKFSPNGLSL